MAPSGQRTKQSSKKKAKTKKKTASKGKTSPKGKPADTLDKPQLLAAESAAKIRRIKTKLAEMKEYKLILAESGMEPDEADKIRESELIVQLLRLEKGKTEKIKPKKKTKKKKTKKKSSGPK